MAHNPDTGWVKAGDTITVAGIYETIPNPDRRWWQFWKPRQLTTDRLQVFTVAATR